MFHYFSSALFRATDCLLYHFYKTARVITVIKENCGVIVTVFQNVDVITQSVGLLGSQRRAASVPVVDSCSLTSKQVKKAQGPATGDKVNKCAALWLIINKCAR